MPNQEQVLDALRTIEDPDLHRDIVSLGFVQELKVAGGKIAFNIELTTPACPVKDQLKQQAEDAVRALDGVESVAVTMTAQVRPNPNKSGAAMLPGIRNVIPVASGKGGVGKSTVAVNLALALASDGARVGLLDADIYGPSQPHMLGLTGEQPVSEDGKTMLPLTGHGLQVMSIGFLVNPDQPMVWRGPMVTTALNQLMHQTKWAALDYLIVDMPPGTGDIQLTLSQKIPVSGAVIVTTPQNIATLDARKGLQMFRKVSISVLGVVENMSTHICSSCGHEEAIFGSGGASDMVADYEIPLLGQLPLASGIREQTDSGSPTVVSDPSSAAAAAYRATAIRIAAALAAKKADYSSKFGSIVVEGTQ